MSRRTTFRPSTLCSDLRRSVLPGPPERGESTTKRLARNWLARVRTTAQVPNGGVRQNGQPRPAKDVSDSLQSGIRAGTHELMHGEPSYYLRRFDYGTVTCTLGADRVVFGTGRRRCSSRSRAQDRTFRRF
jgi:hypothetical protein